VLLDGQTLRVSSLEIATGKLTSDGLPADLTLDDLRRIEIANTSPAPADKPAILAELRGGGRVHASSASIANDQCSLGWTQGDAISLPLDLVRGLRLAPSAATAEVDKALAAPSAELDRVFIQDDAGKLSSVTGLIDALTDLELTIEISGQARKIPRQRLVALIIAQPAATDPPSRCLVHFRDGSALGGDALALSGENASLTFPAGASASFPWSAVAGVTIRSSRLAFLSDLKPIAEEHKPLVTFPRPAQRDKSVSGKALTLGSRVFEKGLGVHARSSLTFVADKKWEVFAATIGIDAAAAGKGDCLFSVVADGQRLYERRVRGADPPYDIQVSIEGREQVTLLVEPGESLDLADHANWCDARFLKNRPK
jgi:hypothetical protein